MLEEYQTQRWSLADWAEQGRGLMFLGRQPCKIIMNSKKSKEIRRFLFWTVPDTLFMPTHALLYSVTGVHLSSTDESKFSVND